MTKKLQHLVILCSSLPQLHERMAKGVEHREFGRIGCLLCCICVVFAIPHALVVR